VEIPLTPEPASLLTQLKPDSATVAGESFELTPAEIERRTERKELRPGLKVALLPKSTRNSVVNLQIGLNYGDESSLRGHNVAARAFADLLLRGTKTLDRVAFDDAIEQLEASVSAAGGSGGLTINARTTREHLPELLELLVAALQTTRLDPQEFETWRKESIAALEYGENDPQTRAFEKSSEISNPYPEGHPRAFVANAQRKSDLAALKLEQVAAFKQRFISAAQAQVAMVGDFDAAAVKLQLTALLGEWTATEAPYTRMPDRPFTRTAVAERVDTPDQANGMLIASLPLAINDGDPDYPALLLANHVLGGSGMDSRLMERLRTKEGWSYGGGSSLNVGLVEPAGSWMAFAIAAPENLLRALKGLQEELLRLHQDGVSTEEFERAKAGWLKSRRVGWADDARLTGMLLGQSELDRTMQQSADLEAAIAALELEQVNAVIAKRLAPAQWNTIIAGDAKKLVKP
jgi:zinc protease